MNIRTLFRLPILALGMAFGLASAQTAAVLSVAPNPAPAGKPFLLTLQGVATSCYTVFSRESVTVSGARIDLRYTVESILVPQAAGSPGSVCPMPVDAGTSADTASLIANLPVFSMPSLKAGRYEVWATAVPSCRYSKPACEIEAMSQSAGTLDARSEAPTGYDFSPDTVKAGQAFSLHLTNPLFDCATGFRSVTATVSAGMIHLSFEPYQQPKGCMDTTHAFGPTFAVPALKAGSYTVWVDRLDRDALINAGTLTAIAGTARNDWYLKQRNIGANMPFTMQLLRDDIGNCNTTFSHDSAYVLGGSIYATFLMESHPEYVCVTDIRPYGPSFPMPGLAPGLYPVLPQELSPCQLAQPVCFLPVKAPVPTDTLVVAKTLAISLSSLRAGAPQVEMRGDFARFALPAGKSGAWHAEVTTLDGRMLAEATVAGAAGQWVAVPVGRAPRHALSLLRLTSPGGEAHWLPIQR